MEFLSVIKQIDDFAVLDRGGPVPHKPAPPSRARRLGRHAEIAFGFALDVQIVVGDHEKEFVDVAALVLAAKLIDRPLDGAACPRSARMLDRIEAKVLQVGDVAQIDAYIACLFGN